MNKTKMKIQAIKTSDGYFIKNGESVYPSNDLLKLHVRFDRKPLEQTWKPGWYKVLDVYAKVEKYTPETNRVIGYRLKEQYIPSEALPKEVTKEFFGENMYESAHSSLYEPVLEPIPESYEDIEVEIDVVAELEGCLVQEVLHFPVYGTYPKTNGKDWAVKNSEIQLGLIDDITTPEILRDERPCQLSSEHSYKIIRTHIKDNIDPKVAEITSDYDFCLTVEKRLPLAEKEEYKYDANWRLFSGRRRKPKMVTGYRTERKKAIYKIAPRLKGKVYEGYLEAPCFAGENVRELKANISSYLDELMQEINRPLRDCPCCKGAGVIEDEKKN